MSTRSSQSSALRGTRRASAKPQSSTPAAEPASEASSQIPPVAEQAPPPKQLTRSQFLMSELTAILAGRPTPPEDQFEPLLPFNGVSMESLGIVEDAVARGLFTLGSKIEEMKSHMRMPRNVAQFVTYKSETQHFEEIQKLVMGLFWEKIKALYPQYADEEGIHGLSICIGWRICKLDASASSLEKLYGGGESLNELFASIFCRKPGADSKS